MCSCMPYAMPNHHMILEKESRTMEMEKIIACYLFHPLFLFLDLFLGPTRRDPPPH